MSAAIRTLMIERLQFPSIASWLAAGWPVARQVTGQGIEAFMSVPGPAHDPANRLMNACSSLADAHAPVKISATPRPSRGRICATFIASPPPRLLNLPPRLRLPICQRVGWRIHDLPLETVNHKSD